MMLFLTKLHTKESLGDDVCPASLTQMYNQLLQCGLWGSSPPPTLSPPVPPTFPPSSWRHPPGIKAHSHWLQQKSRLYGLLSPPLFYWVIPAVFLSSIFVCCQRHIWISLGGCVCCVVGRIIAIIPMRVYFAVIMGTPMIQWVGDEPCWQSQRNLHTKWEF